MCLTKERGILNQQKDLQHTDGKERPQCRNTREQLLTSAVRTHDNMNLTWARLDRHTRLISALLFCDASYKRAVIHKSFK